MSETYEERAANYEKRAAEAHEVDKAWREGDVRVRERALAQTERDMAGYPERQRAQYHHEIVKGVVMMMLEGHANDATSEMVDNAVVHAKFAADVLYPKQEG